MSLEKDRKFWMNKHCLTAYGHPVVEKKDKGYKYTEASIYDYIIYHSGGLSNIIDVLKGIKYDKRRKKDRLILHSIESLINFNKSLRRIKWAE